MAESAKVTVSPGPIDTLLVTGAGDESNLPPSRAAGEAAGPGVAAGPLCPVPGMSRHVEHG
jgi:hypothetical protein